MAAEWFAATLIIVAIFHDWDFLRHAGYLPLPFFWATNDTFMDWYNTAYWAHGTNAYDIWRTIYPPLSFAFLKIFGIGECYQGGTEYFRECDWIGKTTLFVFFALNIPIVFRAYRRGNVKTAIPRTIAVTLGLPALYTLERGNLIIVTFTFFALGFGPVLRSARLKWLSVATAINFKPYLLTTLVAFVLTRKWRALEFIALGCVAIYAITYGIYGAGEPGVLLHNTIDFNTYRADEGFEPMTYGNSLTSILYAINSRIPLVHILGSKPIDYLNVVLPLMIRAGQGTVMLAFAAAAVRGRPALKNSLVTLGLSLAMTSLEVGGYAQNFLLFLIFLERPSDGFKIVATMLAYMLAIPFDRTAAHISHQMSLSYLTNRTVGVDLSLTVGMLVRPVLIIIIQVCLSASVIVQSLRHASEPLDCLETAPSPA